MFLPSSESESEEEEEAVPLLSEEEMNKLGAKLVKAEIMGNTVRAILPFRYSDEETTNCIIVSIQQLCNENWFNSVMILLCYGWKYESM